MSLTMLAPFPLEQQAEQLARDGVRLPGLDRLARAATIERSPRTLDDIAGTLLGVTHHLPMPVAPLRLASDGIDPGDAHWLCADPIALSVLATDVRIGPRIDDLTRDEADALVVALNAELANDEIALVAPAPSRWYATCDPAAAPNTPPLWRAIGRSLSDVLPSDREGAVWRTRLNATQILLHSNPVNAAREARGAAAVGSVWWWGGGHRPVFDRPAVDRVLGGPEWVRAACAANGIRVASEDGSIDSLSTDRSVRTLAVANDTWDAGRFGPDALVDADRRWFTPLADALDAKRIDAAVVWFDADDGALGLHCRRSPGRRLDWRRWFGQPAPRATIHDVLTHALER